MNALTASLNRPTLIGAINMKSKRPTLNYDGALRLFAQAIYSGGQYVNGIDQQRVLIGSRYAPPSKGFFPIGGITATTFNTSYNMLGGDFGGISKIGTWDLSHRISIPQTPTDSTIASFVPTTGLLTYAHTRTEPSKNLYNAVARGYAVALQKPKQIRGYYYYTLSTGALSVTENDGTVPPITTISPLSKAVPVGFTEYIVQVNTTGDWEVLVPAGPTVTRVNTIVIPANPVTGTPETTVEMEYEIPWVSAEVISGGSGLTGNGNGAVRITVQENLSGLWFYSSVEIAGITHKITQDYQVRR